MDAEEKIYQFILTFVKRKRPGFQGNITKSDNLLEILDSIRMIELIIEIEKNLNITVEEEELDIRKISIVSELVNMVKKRCI